MGSFYISIITLGIILVATALIMVAIDWKKSLNESLKIDQKKKELDDAVADAEMIMEEMNKFSGYIVEKIEDKMREFNQLVEMAGSLPVVSTGETQNIKVTEQALAEGNHYDEDEAPLESNVSIRTAIANENNNLDVNTDNNGNGTDKDNVKDENNEKEKDNAGGKNTKGSDDLGNNTLNDNTLNDNTFDNIILDNNALDQNVLGQNVSDDNTLSENKGRNIVLDNINAQKKSNTADKGKSAYVDKNSKYSRIILLYEEGKSIEEISRLLNIGKGEVQLILELRGKNEKV